MKTYYPAFLDLDGRVAVVVGDGPDAAERVRALLEAGARVRVVGPRPEGRLLALAVHERVELRARAFASADLDDAAVAVASCGAATAAAVRAAATAARVPLNVVDRPALCDFIHGAVLRRGALVVAVSTSGAAPAVAVRLRDRFAAEVGPEYADFLDLAAERREAIASSGLDVAARRRLWYRIADSGALEALRDGDRARARALIGAELEAALAEASGAA